MRIALAFSVAAVAILVLAPAGTSATSGPQDTAAVVPVGGEAGLLARRPVPKAPVRALLAADLLPSPIPYERRLMVKFVDAARVRAEDGRPVSRGGQDLTDVAAWALEVGVTFSPLIRLPEETLAGLEQRAARRSGVAQPDLAGMLRVHVPGADGVAADLARLEALGDRLTAFESVEFAEIQTLGAPPPGDISPVTPNLEFQQGYRGPNPGLNSDWAASTGLTGAGIRLFDCEYGWVLTHEDLEDIGVQTEPGQTVHPQVAINTWDEHGTAVLGEIAATANAYGITGMAPDAEVHAYTEWSLEQGLRRLTCVTNAVAAADAGDVVLLEMQSGSGAPVESEASMWIVVKAGTDAGVIVVGAAGNGNQDLDGPGFAAWLGLGDSGALIVGAGSADTTHQKLSFSSHGSRVDVQGWGESVFTTGYGAFAEYGGDKNQRYTGFFSGTSSASPFVASAALMLQQKVEQKLQRRFDSIEMRTQLVTTGLAQTGFGGNIGPFPNMGAAVGNLPPAPWTDEGCSIAGALGPPSLDGTGPLQFGTTGEMYLTNTPPSAVTVMFVAFSSTPVPFMAGTLKAFPFASQILLITDGAGELTLPFNWNFSFPVGTNMWAHTAVVDPTAPGGVSLTNAMRLTTQ